MRTAEYRQGFNRSTAKAIEPGPFYRLAPNAATAIAIDNNNNNNNNNNMFKLMRSKLININIQI